MALAVVQSATSPNTNAFETDATESVSFGVQVPSGRDVVVIILLSATNRTLSSLTDDGGNTYALVNAGAQDASNEDASSGTEVWKYRARTTSPMQTVTAVISSALATPARVVVLEVSGGDTDPEEAVAIADTSGTSHSVGPVTTARAGSLLVAALAGSNGTYTNNAGWTQVFNNTNFLVAYDEVDAASTSWTATSIGTESCALVLVALTPTDVRRFILVRPV